MGLHSIAKLMDLFHFGHFYHNHSYHVEQLFK